MPAPRRVLASLAAAALVLTGSAMAPAATTFSALADSPAQALRAPAASGDVIDAAILSDLEDDGTADFWIAFPERADLSGAASIEDWNARGQAVYDALTSTAEASQAEVRAELDRAGVDYEAFSITNAIRVTDGGAALVEGLSIDPAVGRLYPAVEITPPDAEVGTSAPATEVAPAAVEWGVHDINADDVWAAGTTGEGIVVASIDTGAQWNHPALITSYRGSAGGTVNHNYNWFDAAGTSPAAPHDTNGHGTHVTGTMVGSDGGTNQIGVAPGATWIAANGCCPTDAALVASGEWMLAPTNLAGTTPRPDLRPHIINNSWGTQTPSNQPFMEDISLAWAASGQFAVFAIGNTGPSCGSAASPGSRVVNYAVGNYNASHAISSTSGKGPGQGGATKPDISAPGSSVRSAYPGNTYVQMSGTSMASPHVAGAVALLWSAHPGMIGDIDGTRALLDGTAIDTGATQCGGTAADNNVFGEGRLDAAALVDSAPTDVVRVAGPDRYATAAAVSQTFDPGVEAVFLATGRDYPDALVGAALAGSRSGPVLLTRTDGLPNVTRTELARLSPGHVYLLGGTGAIAGAVATEAAAVTGAPVTRLSGSDRYGTAARIAEEFSGSGVAYIATGANYPDALAGAARAGALDAPVLLTRRDSLPTATRTQLERLDLTSIRVLGGPSAVSPGVLTALAAYGPVTRVEGLDRYATAVAVSQDRTAADTVFVTTGQDWPDALAGAALAGAVDSPVLLVRRAGVPNVTWTELQRLGPELIVLVGGTGAVSADVQQRLRTLP